MKKKDLRICIYIEPTRGIKKTNKDKSIVFIVCTVRKNKKTH
jgi:hypothetical protein